MYTSGTYKRKTKQREMEGEYRVINVRIPQEHIKVKLNEEKWKEETEQRGLKINMEKTKLMVTGNKAREVWWQQQFKVTCHILCKREN